MIQEEEEDFDGNAYVRCETVEYDRKKNFDNLVAVGANATALKPGMLVQGRGVRDGAVTRMLLLEALDDSLLPQGPHSKAFLIGESLVTAADPEEALRELVT